MNNIIKLMTCGDVDSGKSTLLGHLLYDNNLIYEDQKSKIEYMQYAHLLDGLAAEQEQNITIDVAYRFFELNNKKFILADCPGHVQYTKNMATGASNSDLCLVVIDSEKGLTEQAIHHLDICSFLGIKDFIIVINKIDLIEYSEYKYNKLKEEVQEKYNNLNLLFIPISGILGDNINTISKNTSWYNGQSLLDILSNYEIKEIEKDNTQNILSVQHISLLNQKRYIEGLMCQGKLNINDEILILPSKQLAKISKLWHNGKELDYVEDNQNTTILIDREIDISRGNIIISKNTDIVKVSNRCTVNLIKFKEIEINKDYLFKTETSKVICQIKNSNTEINEIDKDIKLELQQELPISINNNHLNQFILIDIVSHETVGYGQIKEIKESKVNEYKTLWFTGLSGAGKTTLAKALQEKYPEYKFVILDGDEVRKNISNDLGFSQEDRLENIRRIASIAKLLNDQKINVLVSCISPTGECRELAKNIIGDSFKLIYISTPFNICKERDVKGLYKQKIDNFTGIDSIYEPPKQYNLKLDTSTISIDDCINKIKNILC